MKINQLSIEVSRYNSGEIEMRQMSMDPGEADNVIRITPEMVDLVCLHLGRVARELGKGAEGK